MYQCTVCKRVKEFETFKDFATHCLKKGDKEHIELAYNDSNVDDWVACKIEDCWFRASRIDFHIKKHGLTRQQYEEKYQGSIFSKNFLKNTSESGKHANDDRDLSRENNPFFGRKHSEKSKQKISDSTLQNNALLDQHFNKGRKMSEETREKMSESKTGEKNFMYGKRRSSVIKGGKNVN